MVRTVMDSPNSASDDRAPITYSLTEKIPAQVRLMDRLFGVTDGDCISNLRMDRNAFGRLCRILRDRCGMVDQRYVHVEEQTAMFLATLAHHKKTRIVGFDFNRSGYTVSHYMHEVMRAVIHLHSILLVEPTPVDDTCDDPRWNWFKGCLGALDETYINVRVSTADAPRYRSRKGQIATNTLAVCDRFLRFVNVLPGWEGSVADSRVLRDAVTRPNGLKVRRGSYYLCDNGYANSEGFLTPFKGVRYHLKEWGPQTQRPSSPKKQYNMRRTMARNVIERAFAVLKMRWGILRSASFYPIETQTRLIMTCFILHNYIRGEMQVDPVEQEMDGDGIEGDGGQPTDSEDLSQVQYVDAVESTAEWNQMRQDLAQYMWQNQ
ncbi:protein ANTAGONIST OF LIKE HETEROCHROMATIN PROTEIN 1-like [Salvia splendens]|uniref:protein ANTAGONIST OF LIKE HETEROCHROMATIN PROTEIN 1-like n=1 Tax=Salvia splendens TaxID=180675 RepID=UPI001C275C95|nr:protein ANTAGONIST OF LIKE HETEROCHROMATIN PROTEIN 1-like [Salvia splendens]